MAAYLVGSPIPKDTLRRTLPDIPVCDAPDRTGGLISWNTVGPKVSRERFEKSRWRYPPPDGPEEANGDKALICVNPLSWRADDAPAPADANLGGLQFGDDPHPKPRRGVTGARCKDGLLEIPKLDTSDWRTGPMMRQDYHVLDYPLFSMNVRNNAVARARAWLRSHEATGSPAAP